MSSFSKRPVRYLITRGDLNESNFSKKHLETLSIIRSAVQRGIELVQIREKALGARDLFQLASHAVKIAAMSETLILVNGRFDIALVAGAQGVHLTSRSIPANVVRHSVPVRFLIGVSAHSKEEVLEARTAGADFALFGNVFATPGKGKPTGLDALSLVCRAADTFPLIAVGGIDDSNAQEVIDAGAAGFAAIRYLNEFVTIEA